MQLDALWERLQVFELDAPNCGLTFSERAARENGWTPDFAKCVIEEYKRFLWLAVRCDHIVCPSDPVDQIWHMHLTYTRNYWDDLCRDILGRPLHHGPTRGGSEEQVKYFRLYEQTLASYQAAFNQPAPQHIWPTARQRFGEDLGFVRVNLNRNWVIPKPRSSRKWAGAASAVLLFPLAQLAASPLDWPGPQFLMLYWALIIAAVLLTGLGRWWLLRPEDSQGGEMESQQGLDKLPIGPFETGWMQGGRRRVIDCALVELIQKEAIAIEGKLIVAGPNVATARADHRVSELILNSVASAPAGRKFVTLCREANVGIEPLRARLIGQGLVLDRSQRAAATVLPIALLGGVLAFGLAKALVGTERDKPIGFLIIAMVIAAVALILFVATVPKLTAGGQRMMRRLQGQIKHGAGVADPVESTPARHWPGVNENALLWSTAILGTTVLASTPWSALDGYLKGQHGWNAGASGGCGTSGCGADSGCSGGSGCGGGGGCGGCGGD